MPTRKKSASAAVRSRTASRGKPARTQRTAAGAPPAAKTAGKSTAGSRSTTSFPIVGLGASAGGLEALTKLFQHLPADGGMAFVVVQHLDPTHRSILPELLAKASAMPVREVTEGMVVAPDRVYVIPPTPAWKLRAAC